MPELTTLVPCTCGHVAYMHHFSRYLGAVGDAGRGKCAAKECHCIEYRIAEAVKA